MELELHRIDLLQTSAASPGTLLVSCLLGTCSGQWLYMAVITGGHMHPLSIPVSGVYLLNPAVYATRLRAFTFGKDLKALMMCSGSATRREQNTEDSCG